MKAIKQKYIVYGLRETYHELGEYEFKVVLNPKFFKNGHSSSVWMRDSDGKPMNFDVKNWGRKMNFRFSIDSSVSDGLAFVGIDVRNESGVSHQIRFSYWVIKP